MKSMVCRFGDFEEKVWTDLESRAKHASVFQTYYWAEVLNAIGTRPLFLMLIEGKTALVGLLLSESRFLSGLFSAYEALGGPLFTLQASENVFPAYVSALRKTVKKEAGLYFYWSPSFQPALEKHLIDQGFFTIPSATFVIDLSLPIETLWRNVEKGARWAVKKAERSGVIVNGARNWEEWSQYYDLYAGECHRKNIRPRSIGLHEAIYNFLVPKGCAQLFVAKHENKIIGGFVTLWSRDEMVWYEGAADPQHLDLYPNNALQWHVISWAKERGIKQYDLGGALWNADKKHFLYGVHVFKKQWGGRLRRYHSFGLNRLYVMGRRLSFQSSIIRRLYYALEDLRAIERTDRV